jgi:hypothetical protein
MHWKRIVIRDAINRVFTALLKGDAVAVAVAELAEAELAEATFLIFTFIFLFFYFFFILDF